MTPEELSWFVDDVVMRALQGVKGVVADRALRRRRARDPRRARPRPAAGASASPPATSTGSCGPTNVDLAGGRGEIGGREQAIRTLAGKQTVADLAATAIVLPSGRKVRLDELGDR